MGILKPKGYKSNGLRLVPEDVVMKMRAHYATGAASDGLVYQEVRLENGERVQVKRMTKIIEDTDFIECEVRSLDYGKQYQGGAWYVQSFHTPIHTDRLALIWNMQDNEPIFLAREV